VNRFPHKHKLQFVVEIPDYVEFPKKEVQSLARESIEELSRCRLPVLSDSLSGISAVMT